MLLSKQKSLLILNTQENATHPLFLNLKFFILI